MPTIIQIRRALASGWSSQVLLEGEIGYETDTGNFKVGNGTTAWSSLVYQFPHQTGARTSALAATLSIDNTNDRVGIGTTTPAQKLDVVGTAAISGNTTVGGTLGVTGNTTLTGDLAVNGADITTTATGTATVFNTNATTLNVGQAATTVSIGATTGTTTIRNATTSINGNATVGGTLGVTGNTTLTGNLAVNGGTLSTTQSSGNLFNSATNVDVGTSATQVVIGATGSGTTLLRNATISINGNATVGGTLGVTGATTLTGAANIPNASITGGSITGITDLAVADGGTGASTAANARTNLGLDSMATQAANNVSITGGSITGITDLAIADGGTGASTAAAARGNLNVIRQFTTSSDTGLMADIHIIVYGSSVFGVGQNTAITAQYGAGTWTATGSNNQPAFMGIFPPSGTWTCIVQNTSSTSNGLTVSSGVTSTSGLASGGNANYFALAIRTA